jgi:HicA toxin of bacterial toxin-antitoxin,
MSKIQKLLERLLCFPKDFTWEELTKILAHFGYTEPKTGKTGGSRRKFENRECHIISLHKPHPGNILKAYQLDQVVEQLKEKGYIPDE